MVVDLMTEENKLAAGCETFTRVEVNRTNQNQENKTSD